MPVLILVSHKSQLSNLTLNDNPFVVECVQFVSHLALHKQLKEFRSKKAKEEKEGKEGKEGAKLVSLVKHI